MSPCNSPQNGKPCFPIVLLAHPETYSNMSKSKAPGIHILSIPGPAWGSPEVVGLSSSPTVQLSRIPMPPSPASWMPPMSPLFFNRAVPAWIFIESDLMESSFPVSARRVSLIIFPMRSMSPQRNDSIPINDHRDSSSDPNEFSGASDPSFDPEESISSTSVFSGTVPSPGPSSSGSDSDPF